MAELKNNKKALESQKMIYKGLRRILLVKPLSEITVTDVSDECNISRTTFYRNFQNVTDVLEVMLDFFYNRYLENRIDEPNQLLYFFQYWSYHKDLITIIATQNDSILKRIMKKYTDQEFDNEYLLNIKYSIFTSLLCTWSKSKKETPEELYELTRKLLNEDAVYILLK